jgi:hypothetical protein
VARREQKAGAHKVEAACATACQSYRDGNYNRASADCTASADQDCHRAGSNKSSFDDEACSTANHYIITSADSANTCHHRETTQDKDWW